MLLAFLVALAIPGAFGRDGMVFALTYAGLRFLHLGLYVEASRRGTASLRAIAGFGVTVIVGMALLFVGALLDDPARAVLWTVAAAIDYAGPAWLTRERLVGLQRVVVAHFAERYSLFVIICLGESIVSVGFGAQGRRLDTEIAAGVALALLATIGLWWTYFNSAADQAEERLRNHAQPVLAAADGYSYLHLLLVAGIIVFAVGAKREVHDVAVPLGAAARLALCGGVALYLAGHVAFARRLLGTVSVAKLVAAAGCLVVFAVSATFPAWATAGMVAAVLAALVTRESLAAPAPR
jgi:low temperature requirement protein LtrA